MTPSRQFPYDALAQSSDTVRFLQVLPNLHNGMIQCEIRRGSIKEKYLALSYTWDSPLPTKEVSINGMPISIRLNLWRFLRLARQEYPSRWIWIDAICINQNDDAERNQQVAMMGSIYRSANLTLIWLGPIDHDTVSSYRSGKDSMLEGVKLDDVDEQLVRLARRFSKISGMNDRKLFRKLPQVSGLEHMCDVLALMFRHSYWSRMWIIQEINLGSNKIVLFDGNRIRWSSLADLIDKIDILHSGVLEDFESEFRKHNPERPIPEWPLHRKLTELWDTCSETSAFKLLNHLTSSRRRYDCENSVVEFLRKYDYAGCHDRRDKVYGLHSLINPILQFPVEYTIDAYEVFFRACDFLDNFEEWPRSSEPTSSDKERAKVDDSIWASSDSEEDEDTNTDGYTISSGSDIEATGITEHNHFRSLVQQLMRSFDLGPADFIFGDELQRTCLVLVSLAGRRKKLGPLLRLSPVPTRQTATENYDQVCQLGINLIQDTRAAHAIGHCPKCQRIILFGFKDDYPTEGPCILQCHANRSAGSSIGDKTGHILLYDGSALSTGWVSDSSKTGSPAKDVSANKSITSDSSSNAVPGTSDLSLNPPSQNSDSELNNSDYPSDSSDSWNSDISSDVSDSPDLKLITSCIGTSTPLLTTTTTTPSSPQFSRQDLSLILEMHETFWTSTFHDHGYGTRHDAVRERETKLESEKHLDRFRELLGEGDHAFAASIKDRCSREMLDALHLEEKAERRLVEALRQIGMDLET